MFLARFHPPGRAFVRDLTRSQIEAQQEIKKLLRMRRYNLYRLDMALYWGEQLRRYLDEWDDTQRSARRSPRETDPDPGAKRQCPRGRLLRAGRASWKRPGPRC